MSNIKDILFISIGSRSQGVGWG